MKPSQLTAIIAALAASTAQARGRARSAPRPRRHGAAPPAPRRRRPRSRACGGTAPRPAARPTAPCSRSPTAPRSSPRHAIASTPFPRLGHRSAARVARARTLGDTRGAGKGGRAWRPAIRRRLRLPRDPLPDARPAALRALLPLPLVPARDRLRLRAQRADRERPGRAPRRTSRTLVLDPERQRQGPADRALPGLPDRGLEPLRRRRRRASASSASARSTTPTASRRTSTSSPRPSSPG